MKATFTFKHLYKEPFTLNTDSEVINFFKEMKRTICSDLLKKNVPLLSLIPNNPAMEKVMIVQDDIIKNDNTFSGLFQVIGVHSKTVYDSITVEIQNVEFMKKLPSIENYISSILKMRYSGYLIQLEDVEEYSQVTGMNLLSNNLHTLDRITEVENLLEETHRDKVKRVARELNILVKEKPFEVFTTLMGITQKVYYLYDNEEHMDYLEYLVDRTRTHEVSIRVIENEIYEIHQLAKKAHKPNIRKSKLYAS